jgi:signal transduction histidine kinase
MTAELSALSREFDATVLRLRESRERERCMERSRRQLVAWAIRDLQTPLARLQAMAEALEDGIAADVSRYHQQIRAEVTRPSAMTDDLLQLSCIESETPGLSPGGISPDGIEISRPAGMRAADHILTPDRETGRLRPAAKATD